ncbi:hypothetical protein HYX19_01990 [Candidatus Woesearchaeota archaeon]|nr:hypothetical protein [Candidatus Woesearchaeota archaeon]
MSRLSLLQKIKENEFKQVTNYRPASRLELRNFNSCYHCMYKTENEKEFGGQCSFLYRGLEGNLFYIDIFNLCSKFKERIKFKRS